eukprot:scaffold1637_cov195-Alexandrium_tamarense.AAC.23
MARPHKLARQLLEEICNPDSTYVDDHVVRMEEILSFMGRVGICCEQSTSRRQTQKYRRMQQSDATVDYMDDPVYLHLTLCGRKDKAD